MTTRFLGPTESKGARMAAINMTSNKRTVVPYDHELDDGDNHERVARLALGNGHEYTGTVASASISNGGRVFTSRGKSGGIL